MKNKNTVIKASGISIGYKNHTVAENLSITLNSGTLYTLIGANGIGKSTLLRTLSGLQKILLGNVLLNGLQVENYTPNQLAQQLSLVLTDALPQGNLSVYELVALGRQPYTNWMGSLSAEDNVLIEKSLQLTDTIHLAHKKVHELSDGQLQNVLIARALAQDTPLIILDEPTTHLDLPHKAGLLKLLKKLALEAGKCILYSTHDLDLALQLSDEILVMKKDGLFQGTLTSLDKTNALSDLFNDPTIVYDSAQQRFIYKLSDE